MTELPDASVTRSPGKLKLLPLSALLTRMIWACTLPPTLLAGYFAVTSVLTLQTETNLEASNIATNLATAIDHNLNARIGALQMLASSPLANDTSLWNDFYEEARGFRQSFGSNVIFADLQMHMLFNTRTPFGTPLPMLPRPDGHAAAPAAVASGQPAVGDIFPGPIAGKSLVAIAVPGMRDGKAAFLLLATFETGQFQSRLDEVALPPEWSLALLDGRNAVIAVRSPPGLNRATDLIDAERFVVKSASSPWSVVLEIPRATYRAPLVGALTAFALTMVGAILISILGGFVASRRIRRSVRSLLNKVELPDIVEIASVRHLLDAAEDEIRGLAVSLEKRVEERTAELTAANHELDSFAYAVSHDLRAPLRALNGFSQALVEDYGDRLDGEARIYLDQIAIASRKMGELIEGILVLSRSTRGELQRDPIDISALATRLFTELALNEPERQLGWQVEPGLRAKGDERMIEVVLRNLLGNAWKYTGKTEVPTIRVFSGEVGGQSGFCVADNGAGFDMAHADQLFQPFRRLHRQEEFQGIGIGLATVQSIIHRHGGEICAEGKPGVGATFCFSLPASVPEESS